MIRFFIYKITNNINQKEYIGQHVSSKDDLNIKDSEK
jgi:hypothetical protein